MAKLKEITLRMIVDNEGNVQRFDATTQAMKRAENQAKNFNREVNESTRGLGKQTRATNLAGQSALELSRIGSDMAYGFRGIANNIGQVATMFIQLAATENVATGATYGFAGALRALRASLAGPMGIIVAIQTALGVYQLWKDNSKDVEGSQKDLEKQVKKTTKAIEDQAGSLMSMIVTMGALSGDALINLGNDIRELVPRFDELKEEGKGIVEIVGMYEDYIKQKHQVVELSKALRAERESEASNSVSVLSIQTKLNETLKAMYENEAKLFGIKQKRKEQDEDIKRRGGVITDKMLSDLDLAGIKYQTLAERLKEMSDEFKEMTKEAKDFFGYGLQDDFPLLLFVDKFSRQVRAFTPHLGYMSDTLYNISDAIQSVSETMEQENEQILRIQKALAIASVTIDTITAVANIQAKTPLIGSLMAAAIISRGLAQIAAIRAQGLDGNSQLSGANNAQVPNEQNQPPVTTTGFSNLSGGETPGSAVKVYVLEHDIRTTTDKVSKTKVRSRL